MAARSEAIRGLHGYHAFRAVLRQRLREDAFRIDHLLLQQRLPAVSILRLLGLVLHASAYHPNRHASAHDIVQSLTLAQSHLVLKKRFKAVRRSGSAWARPRFLQTLFPDCQLLLVLCQDLVRVIQLWLQRSLEVFQNSVLSHFLHTSIRQRFIVV